MPWRWPGGMSTLVRWLYPLRFVVGVPSMLWMLWVGIGAGIGFVERSWWERWSREATMGRAHRVAVLASMARDELRIGKGCPTRAAMEHWLHEQNDPDAGLYDGLGHPMAYRCVGNRVEIRGGARPDVVATEKDPATPAR